MSNQIVISSGAKVRNLDGVLTGSTGIVGSVPLGAANGVATLDALGKVPLSQLPASVVTYLGTWNAATNTPTLANGTGDTGDLYICNVAGTVNFGAGPITFSVGDWVIYSGTTWERSAGSTGTVTSVAVTESGDALSITGSPITTAGTINIGFAGTSGQYINGAGGLTTFPSLTGYVPYTGATANVDLGTYDLSAGLGTFTSGGSDNTLTINHTSGSGIALNITKSGNGEGLYVNKISGSGNAATINGDVQINSGTLTGTSIILSQDLYLENNKYIYAKKSTGATSYNIIGINLSDKVSIDATGMGSVFGGNVDLGNNHYYGGSILLKQGIGSVSATGYFSLSGSTGSGVGSLILGLGSGTTSSMNFPTSSNYTYTFPAATGTLALTSDLSGYVPYTGATANVDLGAYSITTTGSSNAQIFYANGNVSNAGQISMKWGTGFASPTGYSTLGGFNNGFILISNIGGNQKLGIFDLSSLTTGTQRTYTLPDASGTIALLSGTQTFTGKVIVNTGGIDNQIAAIGTAPSLRLANAVTGATINGFIAMAGATNDYITGAVAGDMCIGNQNSGKIIYGFGSGTATAFMTITSTGLGIGTSSPQNSLVVSSGGAEGVEIYANSNGGNIFAYNRSTSSYKNILLAAGGGNVGIGTISPDSYANKTLQLHNPSTGSTYFKISNSTTGSAQGDGLDIGEINNDTYIWNRENGFMSFATNGAERTRITNDGIVLVNTTSATAPDVFMEIKGDDGHYNLRLSSNAMYAGAYRYAQFVAGGGGVGTITSNGSSTSYNTTSDYRLKEDLQELKGLDKVLAIKTYDYKWKNSELRTDGVLAHELAEVLPYAVNGEKDGQEMQGVDYSKIVPVLVAAIQELEARIKQLENK